MDATEAVVKFAEETGFDDIPPEAREKAKQNFLDIIGLGLAGTKEPASHIARDFVKETGGTPVSSVIGGGFKTSQPAAAFANGITAHAPECDDADYEILTHPSPVLMPALLAVGEACGSSGRDVLEAYIIGWEVIGGIGRAVQVNFNHAVRGWQATGTIAVFGAAIAAAKLMKLNGHQITMALGIAAAEASGTMGHWGTMTEPFIAGDAARSGVVAAMLAKNGFTASPAILERHWGFFDVYGGEGSYDATRVARKLGNPYTFVSPGALIKKYGCIAPIQVPFEAMQEMVRREGFGPDEVESVEDGVSPQLVDDASYPEPDNTIEARYSVWYSIAAGIAYPDLVGLAPYEQERIADPRVRGLLKKIRIYIHPELAQADRKESLPVNYLKVKLKDGREFSVRADKAGGFPNKPMSEAELLGKYRYCAATVLPAQRIDRSIELLQGLEKVGDIRELLSVLMGETGEKA